MQHKINILMRMLYLKVNVLVHGLAGPSPPELGLSPDTWSIDSHLSSTYIPSWTLGKVHSYLSKIH